MVWKIIAERRQVLGDHIRSEGILSLAAVQNAQNVPRRCARRIVDAIELLGDKTIQIGAIDVAAADLAIDAEEIGSLEDHMFADDCSPRMPDEHHLALSQMLGQPLGSPRQRMSFLQNNPMHRRIIPISIKHLMV